MNKDESIRFATKYLEDLLSFFGINIAVDSTLEDDVIQLSIPSTSMNSLLIGREANNLRALQHVVSMALVSRSAELTRVNVDVADYKRQRAERIADQAEGWIREVRQTGRPKQLNLNAVDRRIVVVVAGAGVPVARARIGAELHHAEGGRGAGIGVAVKSGSDEGIDIIDRIRGLHAGCTCACRQGQSQGSHHGCSGSGSGFGYTNIRKKRLPTMAICAFASSICAQSTTDIVF